MAPSSAVVTTSAALEICDVSPDELLGELRGPVLDLLGHVVLGEGRADEREVVELVDDAGQVLLEAARLLDGLGARGSRASPR